MILEHSCQGYVARVSVSGEVSRIRRTMELSSRKGLGCCRAEAGDEAMMKRCRVDERDYSGRVERMGCYECKKETHVLAVRRTYAARCVDDGGGEGGEKK